MRLFAAINPPEAVFDHLETALSMLGEPPAAPMRADRRQHGRARRAALRSPWTPREGWHITLAFFGDVPGGVVPELEEAISTAVTDVEPFDLQLTGAGTFRSTVTWVGVGGQTQPLVRLMRALAVVRDEHTLTPDHRERNRAHLTISRAGATVDSAHIAHALAIYRGPEWEVESIDLIESELGAGAQGRPTYPTRRTFPLR